MRLIHKADYEKVPLARGESFACREFRLPRFNSPWHFHPEIELTYIANSSGQRFVGDSIEPFESGDLVLVGANLPHFWRNFATAKSRTEFAHSLVIQFRSDFLGETFLEAPELRPVADLLERAKRGLQFSGATRDRVAEAIRKMKGMSGPGRVANLLTMLAQLAAADDWRILSSSGFAPNLDENAVDRIARCHRYVFANIEGEIRLEGAAAAAGMSPSAFCRYFRRATGKTFFDFVNELRTGQACRLLIETDLSITGICYAAGFSSLSNFNRRFREHKGVTPREFRRAHTPESYALR